MTKPAKDTNGTGKRKVSFIRRLDKVEQLSGEEKSRLAPVVDRYVFRANDYYLGLIDWDDPDDPIRKIIIPREEEMEEFGELDASNESANYPVPHLQHKYLNTALLMVSEVCGAYCRFCFRKRLFMDDVHETSLDIGQGIEYIAAHPEIDNVLMTGGDPLLISPRKLDAMFERILAIPHVRIVRLGTKIPAFDPMRISGSPELLESIRRHSRGEKQIVFMTHFNHPRELTAESMAGLEAIREAGGVMAAQSPLLEGVNDDPAVLTELYNRLSYLGVTPYYVFQGRPTEGNEGFKVRLERGFRIFEEAKVHMSGLARRLRYAMSHAAGKVEILGVTPSQVFLKFHQARDPHNLGKVFALPKVPSAYWLDDLLEHPRAPEALISQGIRVAPTGRTWEEWTGTPARRNGNWSPARTFLEQRAAR
jgi:KamA family protein